MKELLNIIKCPFCGETWHLHSDILSENCYCFRCHNNYKPDKLYKTWDYILYAIKNIKGK